MIVEALFPGYYLFLIFIEMLGMPFVLGAFFGCFFTALYFLIEKR